MNSKALWPTTADIKGHIYVDVTFWLELLIHVSFYRDCYKGQCDRGWNIAFTSMMKNSGKTYCQGET
jgi:hypothetical protein